MIDVKNKKILIVEDDCVLLSEIAEYFRKLGNTIHTANNLALAKKQLTTIQNLDIILLDIVLPDGSGLDLMRIDHLPPVIVLSDLSSEENILEGFESGVTDYVVKPCSMKLLETRISLRLLPKNKAIIRLDDFSIDSANRTASWHNKDIPLTVSEFNILYFLASHPGQYYSADEIYESVWKAPALNSTTVRRHLSSLRLKMQEVVPTFDLIVTKFGRGYAFSERQKTQITN